MIWNEELAASLDQGTGVVVFHHAEVSRTQQLASTLAERLGALVEASEKTLDSKQGGGVGAGWGERAEGAKGERRGEQAQERSGRERSRGGSSTRGMSFLTHDLFFPCSLKRFIGTRGGRGARFSQGLGNRMQGTAATTRVR